MSEQTDAELRAQIEELIRDEIQEGINEYLDEQEKIPLMRSLLVLQTQKKKLTN